MNIMVIIVIREISSSEKEETYLWEGGISAVIGVLKPIKTSHYHFHYCFAFDRTITGNKTLIILIF